MANFNKRKMKIRVYFYDDQGFGKLIDLLSPYISYCHIMETENDYKKAVIGLKMHGLDADLVTENGENTNDSEGFNDDTPQKGDNL